MYIKMEQKSIGLILFCIFVFATVIFNSLEKLSVIANIAFIPFSFFSCVRIIQKQKIKLLSEIKIFGLFVLICFLTLIKNDNTTGIGLCYSLLSMLILLTFATYMLEYSDVVIVENWIIISAFVLLLVTFLWGDSFGRLGEGVSNSINLAIILSICSIIFMYRFFYGKGLVNLFFYIVTLFFILLTQTRGALLITLFLFMACYFISNKQIMPLRKVFLVLVLLLSAYIGNEWGFLQQYTQRFVGVIDQISAFQADSFQSQSSTAIRLYLKVVGFRFFLEEPLLGHGLGTTRQFLGGTYFHDNYIQLLYETGITGLGLYLAVLLSVFIKALKAKCHLAALYIAFILLYGIFDVTYHNKLFYIMLALAIVLTKRKEKRLSCESLTYHTSG